MSKLENLSPDQQEAQLERWLTDLCSGSQLQDYVTKEVTQATDTNGGFRIKYRLFTEKRYYAISFFPITSDKESGYLGCVYSMRSPYPGEDHTRGRDLQDGNFSKETWESIKNDIIRTELELLATGKSVKNKIVYGEI